MVSLTPNPIDADLREFCESEGITTSYYQVPKFAGQIAISVSAVTEIVGSICRRENLPIYVHSVHGSHTTGLIFMCLRKLQLWSTRAIHSKFNQFVSDST
jgi:protein tyrosine/serine phosphatase